jgi:hypothetical protein
MALTAGSKLGFYEIQSQLGTGGMGEVFRTKNSEPPHFRSMLRTQVSN